MTASAASPRLQSSVSSAETPCAPSECASPAFSVSARHRFFAFEDLPAAVTMSVSEEPLPSASQWRRPWPSFASVPAASPSCPSSPSSLFPPEILLPSAQRSEQMETAPCGEASDEDGGTPRPEQQLVLALRPEAEESAHARDIARADEIESGSAWGIYMLASLALAAAAAVTRQLGGEASRKKCGAAKRQQLFTLLGLPLPSLPSPCSFSPRQSSYPRSSFSVATSILLSLPLPWPLARHEEQHPTLRAASRFSLSSSSSCSPLSSSSSSPYAGQTVSSSALEPGTSVDEGFSLDPRSLSFLQPPNSPVGRRPAVGSASLSLCCESSEAPRACCACSAQSPLFAGLHPHLPFASLKEKERFFAKPGARVALLYEGWLMKESKWRRVWRPRYLMLFAVFRGPCEALQRAEGRARKRRLSDSKAESDSPSHFNNSWCLSHRAAAPESGQLEPVFSESLSAPHSSSVSRSLQKNEGRREEEVVDVGEPRMTSPEAGRQKSAPTPGARLQGLLSPLFSRANSAQVETRGQEPTGVQRLVASLFGNSGEEGTSLWKKWRESRRISAQERGTIGPRDSRKKETQKETGRLCKACARCQLFLAAYEVNPRCGKNRASGTSEAAAGSAPSSSSSLSRCPDTHGAESEANAGPSGDEEKEALVDLLGPRGPPPTEIIPLNLETPVQIVPAVLRRSRIHAPRRPSGRDSSASLSSPSPFSSAALPSPWATVSSRLRRSRSEKREVGQEAVLNDRMGGDLCPEKSPWFFHTLEEEDDAKWECLEETDRGDGQVDRVACETLLLRGVGTDRLLRLAPCSLLAKAGHQSLPSSLRIRSLSPSSRSSSPRRQLQATAVGLPLQAAQLPQDPRSQSNSSDTTAPPSRFSSYPSSFSSSASSASCRSPSFVCSSLQMGNISSVSSSSHSSPRLLQTSEAPESLRRAPPASTPRTSSSLSFSPFDDSEGCSVSAARRKEGHQSRCGDMPAEGRHSLLSSLRGPWNSTETGVATGRQSAAHERGGERIEEEGDRRETLGKERETRNRREPGGEESGEEEVVTCLLQLQSLWPGDRPPEVKAEKREVEEKGERPTGECRSVAFSQDENMRFRFQDVFDNKKSDSPEDAHEGCSSSCCEEAGSRELRMWAEAINLFLYPPCRSSSCHLSSCSLCSSLYLPHQEEQTLLSSLQSQVSSGVWSRRSRVPLGLFKTQKCLLPFLTPHPRPDAFLPSSSPLQLFLSPCRFAALSSASASEMSPRHVSAGVGKEAFSDARTASRCCSFVECCGRRGIACCCAKREKNSQERVESRLAETRSSTRNPEGSQDLFSPRAASAWDGEIDCLQPMHCGRRHCGAEQGLVGGSDRKAGRETGRRFFTEESEQTKEGTMNVDRVRWTETTEGERSEKRVRRSFQQHSSVALLSEAGRPLPLVNRWLQVVGREKHGLLPVVYGRSDWQSLPHQSSSSVESSSCSPLVAPPPLPSWQNQEILLLSLLQAERSRGNQPPPSSVSSSFPGLDRRQPELGLSGDSAFLPVTSNRHLLRCGRACRPSTKEQGRGDDGRHEMTDDNWVKWWCDRIGFDDLRLRLFTYAVANKGSV
ncbi:hypothetical protein TGME49_238420 [Toxoplasma gondii ME49]|uniref:Uncharacterized protein n=2 Tax=Toxoplasma gondii TaxID=5811 RepID=A0A125YUE2_TOXGV|nr:hypothetical protein TGME49_238420 [Toxoplasma gondii ME49]EPT30841.1 hypothetical protein TGME49_238420 [Toxoplasma gondii ME49]ESS31269.1 hypothetical protein TGVEG_238420 [Toxoplasma gondii VEG]CEL73509.1 TPA: hypothetical protein BN1205_036190 [Toxoplasma gondii VEG]|eukprot:XP_018637689.1 hypothetical protein TGME49_238420 [Toxoplasma gondii ME49]